MEIALTEVGRMSMVKSAGMMLVTRLTYGRRLAKDEISRNGRSDVRQ